MESLSKDIFIDEITKGMGFERGGWEEQEGGKRRGGRGRGRGRVRGSNPGEVTFFLFTSEIARRKR